MKTVGKFTFGSDVLNGRRSYVHDQRVDELDVVPVARLFGIVQLQPRSL